ncbi:hypothetical protein GQ600_26635 [Phytophthora cactorum]|nr:hypothetical protein GQ600_26635 [Phytophthora cactorum]
MFKSTTGVTLTHPHEPWLNSTCIDDDLRLHEYRPTGAEYVNAYNSTLMQTIKCNHDVQFVLGCGTKNAAAYICKYCMKKQNPIDNRVRFSLAAFNRAAVTAV